MPNHISYIVLDKQECVVVIIAVVYFWFKCKYFLYLLLFHFTPLILTPQTVEIILDLGFTIYNVIRP